MGQDFSMGEGDVLKNKSNYEARTFRLPPDVLKSMDDYSELTGISKTAIVEKALRKYLGENFSVFNNGQKLLKVRTKDHD